MVYSACWEDNSQSPEERDVKFNFTKEMICNLAFPSLAYPRSEPHNFPEGPPFDVDTVCVDAILAEHFMPSLCDSTGLPFLNAVQS